MTCTQSVVSRRAAWGAFLITLLDVSAAFLHAGEIANLRAREASRDYQASAFSPLSMDGFARFPFDPQARPSRDEMVIGAKWRLVLPAEASPLAELMAGHLLEFLNRRMTLSVTAEKLQRGSGVENSSDSIALLENPIDSGGSREGSFAINVESSRIVVEGNGSSGLRDGVVHLVRLMSLRQSPVLPLGKHAYQPRVARRVGVVPWMGSYRDLVFNGYNGVVLSGSESRVGFRPITDAVFSLYSLSTSDAIPELAALRDPDAIGLLRQYAEGAQRYGLASYVWLNMRPIFPVDHPAFQAHPDIRGALMYDDATWYQKPGKHILCTESPLVRRYISESVKGLFDAIPGLAGIGVIIGGEEFHHCFMRPYAAERGHTTCARCEAVGADTAVANLCNYMAEAARKSNPDAMVFAWPYSAASVWSIGDPAQLGLIRKLKPGVALFTDIVKDDTMDKPDGVKKLLWDYSIDMPGPGKLAQQQIKACRDAGIAVHLKSEPELAFEASRLPGLPCMDRWVQRANAMASSGADGAWIFPWFIPCLGSSTSEVFSYFWWDPAPDAEVFLELFAGRIAGPEAGPHLRNAWRHASQAMDYSPEIGPYFTGVCFLGPAHPMCADPSAKLPDEFATLGGASFAGPPTGNVPVFAKLYRKMADSLAMARREVDLAEPLVPQANRLAFNAEASSLRWFHHTMRSTANYYESCLLRDRLLALAKEREATKDPLSPASAAECCEAINRWKNVLLDERENSAAALPVMAADIRLDFYYGYAGWAAPGRFHGADMIRKKLEILDAEIRDFLPSVAKRCGGR